MPSDWTLSLIYWIHMLATVVWLGALSSLTLLLIPYAQAKLEPAVRLAFLESVQRRLDPLGWLCLALLTGTGMFQMSAHPQYGGLLAIDNQWAVALLLKHIAIGGMVAVNAALSLGVLPALRRAALRLSKGVEAPEIERLQRREIWLLRLNLLLGGLVLAFTALARVS